MINDKSILFANKRNVSPAELIAILKVQQENKLELTVPPSKVIIDNGRIHILGATRVIAGASYKQDFDLEPTTEFMRQISTKYSIPAKYRDLMLKDNPRLLDQNLNSWLQLDADVSDGLFTIRAFADNTGKGHARCALGDSYGFIDNLESIVTVMQVIEDYNKDIREKGDFGKTLKVVQCRISPIKMYVLVTTSESGIEINNLDKLYRNPETGDRSNKAVIGFELSNSEVGKASFLLKPFMGFDSCANGQQWKRFCFRKIHKGSKLQEGVIKWNQDVLEKHAALEFAKIKQKVQEFCSDEFIGKRIEEIEEAMNTAISDPVNVFHNMRVFGFSEAQCDDMLNLFAASGGEKNVFTVSQSVNYLAHSQENPDNISDLQTLAGDILLDPSLITRIDKNKMNFKESKFEPAFVN